MAKNGKIAKTNHSTAKPHVIETRKPVFLGEYYDLKQMQPRTVTMRFLQLLAGKLVEWADRDDSISLGAFCRLAGMTKKAFYAWIDRCPELKEAHEYALEALGDRRESGAVTKRFDTSAVWRCQYQYGQSYREAMEFAAKLAKKEDLDDNGGTKIVIIEKMVTDPSMEKYFKRDEDVSSKD